MKSSLILSLVITSLTLISTSSYALVIEDASCTGQGVEVSIVDNQGIGFNRQSRPFATVINQATGAVIESFAVKAFGAANTPETKGFASSTGAFKLEEGKPGVAQPRTRTGEEFTLTLNGQKRTVSCTTFSQL